MIKSGAGCGVLLHCCKRFDSTYDGDCASSCLRVPSALNAGQLGGDVQADLATFGEASIS
jgi:hypothetical protein